MLKSLVFGAVTLVLVLVVMLIVVLGSSSRRQTDLREQNDATARKAEALQASLDQSQVALRKAQQEIDRLKKEVERVAMQASAGAARAGSPGSSTVGLSPVPSSPSANALQVSDALVEAAGEGLVATLRLKPSNKDALEPLGLIVRLPKTDSARILEFKPADPSLFASMVARVDGGGKFAMFHADINETRELVFLLRVSGPTVATLSGTSGIGQKEIDIQP